MRFLMTVVLVGLLLCGVAQSVGGDKAETPPLWPLEGELKVHPKYLYRYYIVFGNGQSCALYGRDEASDQLARLEPGARIRVQGVLGTKYHAGGTKDNLSPFPAAWVLYMDVHEVEKLADPTPKLPEPNSK